MQRAGGGYTIVEVLIVLAISAVLLLSALTLLNGRSSSTQFNQAMQDLASKIQSYATQATSGAVPDTSQLQCVIGGNGRPVFSNGAAYKDGVCVFIGRALLIKPTSSTISAYAIAGARNNAGRPAETIDQANITTMRVGSNNLFQEDYTTGGLNLISSTINGTSGYNLVGLYTDLQGNSSPDSANSSGLLTYGYPFSWNQSTESADVQACVEGNLGTYGDCRITNSLLKKAFTKWSICVSYGGSKGLIDITTTGSGLNSQVNIKNCS
jgi:prepilin-type N-terminal cleavage/methylation domain-containing protein